MPAKVTQFLREDIWRIRSSELNRPKFLLVKILRVIILSIRGFIGDNCSLQASALTFYTLLSIIPIFAMAFGIAKGFGLESAIEREILSYLKGQEEVAKWLINLAYSFLANTQGGVIAGIGVVVLIWTVIGVLNNIESSFNVIWKTRTQRAVIRKITDYISIMLISPILLITASSVTVYITREVITVVGKVSVLEQVSPFIHYSLGSIPYLATWVLFTLIYMVMPNKRVHLLPALLGGIIAGTLFQIFEFVYIYFQVGVSKYNAIYGSFAALPLFLVWLHASWLILLYGAEISYAAQNADNYEHEPDYSQLSYSAKEVLMLSIVRLIIQTFARAAASLTTEQIARQLDMPRALTQDLLHNLVQAGVISPTKGDAKNDAAWENSNLRYQPAFHIDRMTISLVLEMWRKSGMSGPRFGQSHEVNKISETLQTFYETVAKSSANKLLQDI